MAIPLFPSSPARGRAAALWLALLALPVAAADNAAALRLVAGVAPAAACATPEDDGALRAQVRALPDSEVASGRRDIRRAWLAAPSDRHAHAALGSRTHATSLHAVVATAAGERELRFRLADDRVFEDRRLRLQDLDGDGRDEIIVVEAQADSGAALVVFGVEGEPSAPRLVERARGPYVGAMRWLNPVGAADFDGDGRLELVSVTTPHIGGVLTLYRYQPPRLVPLAREVDVSNHRMGAVEQRLAAILQTRGGVPAVLVPDQSRRTLRLLAWDGAGGWREQAAPLALPAVAERIEAHRDGACLRLDDGRWLLVGVRGDSPAPGRAPGRARD